MFRRLLTVLLTASTCFAAQAQRAPSHDFPDPFVLQDGGTKYAYATQAAGRYVQVMTSTDRVNWEIRPDAMPTLAPWVLADNASVWAPEVMRIGAGDYRLYYTARDRASGKQCIGVASATSPLGPFSDTRTTALVCQVSLGGSIDPNIFRAANGQLYLYYKNDGNCCGMATTIWGQALTADGRTLTGTPVALIRNDQPWEGALVEAPSMWQRGSGYGLFFSANHYGDARYAVGYASCSGPLGPCTKAPTNPILKSGGGLHGPGHQSLFNEGGQDYIAYHGWLTRPDGSRGDKRVLYIDRLSWANLTPAVVGVTPVPGPLNPLPDGAYRLVAAHSGKVADVAGCSTAPGANVHQWDWLGGDCQRWQLSYAGSGRYTVTARHSGQALDVAGCDVSEGANVQQWTANGLDCQQWRFEPLSDGAYRVVSQRSGKVLDVLDCNAASGANIRQWLWVDSPCQHWRVEPVSANQVAAGVYQLVAKHSGQLLDAAGCSTAPGTNVQQWPNTNAPCQRWAIHPTPDGFFELTPQHATATRLDLAGGIWFAGANIDIWTANGFAPQRWSLESVGAGFHRLVNKESGKVMEVAGCSTTNGANVQQWTWNGGDCQRWQLVRLP